MFLTDFDRLRQTSTNHGALRVLFVGSNQLRYAGKRFFATPQKIANGLIRQGASVISISDRDLARLAGRFKIRNPQQTTQAFIRLCHDLRPDLIIYGHVNTLLPEAFVHARKLRAKQALMTLDGLFVPDHSPRVRQKSALVDAVFVTTWGPSRRKLLASEGVPAYFIPNPVDTAIDCCRAFENKNTSYDIFFASGNAGPGDDRYDLPHLIQTERPNYVLNWRMVSRDGGLWGAEYYGQISTSRCGLNLTRKVEKNTITDPDDWVLYSSDRLSHYVGNGLLALTDRAFGLEKLFPNEELVNYSGADEFLHRLDAALSDTKGAHKSAKAAWARAHADYSADKVARFIAERTLGTGNFTPAWPDDAVYLNG